MGGSGEVKVLDWPAGTAPLRLRPRVFRPLRWEQQSWDPRERRQYGGLNCHGLPSSLSARKIGGRRGENELVRHMRVIAWERLWRWRQSAAARLGCLALSHHRRPR